jgi:hypothetical protein
MIFIYCSEFHPPDITNIPLVDIELKSCSCDFIKNCLQTFNAINYMFIGFTHDSIIPSDENLSKPKQLELYIFKKQFGILNEIQPNLMCLTINMMEGHLLLLNLTNVAHVEKISILTSTLDFNILHPEYITDLVCYSSLSFALSCKSLTRLKTFKVLSIPLESVIELNCSLFQIIENYVPRTANIQLYAEDSPHMIHVCKHLMDKKINFELIYYNNESFINCRLIQRFIPGIKFSKFNSVFFNAFSAYELADDLKNISNDDLFQYMTQKQKLKWYNLHPTLST